MLINYLRKNGCLSEERFNKLKLFIIPVGMITLASSIIINRFFNANGMLDFISGFLMGISIVANITGIIAISTIWKRNKN